MQHNLYSIECNTNSNVRTLHVVQCKLYNVLSSILAFSVISFDDIDEFF